MLQQARLGMAVVLTYMSVFAIGIWFVGVLQYFQLVFKFGLVYAGNNASTLYNGVGLMLFALAVGYLFNRLK